MRKLIFICLLTTTSLLGQTPEEGSYVVVANDSRATAIKTFFHKPFKIMEKNACTATFTKSGIQREHGGGEVQDYSLAWVQIIGEVGEKVDWVCKGER